MNSLTYLSRQFDVLASARTPPSTPVHESASLALSVDADTAASLKRVQTWSTKSFLVDPSASSSSSWGLKRSYSSPAEVHPADSASASSTPAQPRRPSVTVLPPPPARRPSVSAAENTIRPKSRSESVLHRILLVRVLLSLWHYLCDVWRSLAEKLIPRAAHEAAAEEASDDEEKDTEDETKDEKPAGLIVQEPPPIPPPICHAPLPQLSAVSRSSTDSTVFLLEPKEALPEQPPIPSVTLTRHSDVSRTPTPTLAKGKTPLHLPKTLVLDLDETLIHSTTRPFNHVPGSGLLSGFGFGRRNQGAGHMVEVVLSGRSTLYHVYKRPFVDYFLRKVRCSHSRREVLKVTGRRTRRSPLGTHSLYLRHLCKSMPILSLTG